MHNNAQYPIRRTEMKNFPIVKGLSKIIINNLTNGTVPSRVVFGLVSSAAYEGDSSLNPIKFQHYNVNRIAIIVDGKEVDKALELDYKKDKFVRAYHSLFTAINRVWISQKMILKMATAFMLMIYQQIYIIVNI
jgi:hypothetical protein